MIVNRYRQHFLGAFLADNIVIENTFDFMRLGQLADRRGSLILHFFTNNVIT